MKHFFFGGGEIEQHIKQLYSKTVRKSNDNPIIMHYSKTGFFSVEMTNVLVYATLMMGLKRGKNAGAPLIILPEGQIRVEFLFSNKYCNDRHRFRALRTPQQPTGHGHDGFIRFALVSIHNYLLYILRVVT